VTRAGREVSSGPATHINHASNRTGWVFIGRMTMKEFLKQLNKPE
jgi:hypothetical protein